MRPKPSVLSSLLLLVAPALHSAPADGPYGIAMGADPSTLGCKLDDPGRGLWRCAHPPRPASGFTQYSVLASGSAGVCHVLAASDVIRNDAAGSATRARVQQAAQRLGATYGMWRSHADGTAGTADGTWMSALQRREQSFSYTWFGPMQDDVMMIVLQAEAIDATSGKVTVEYFFANPECAREHDRNPRIAT